MASTWSLLHAHTSCLVQELQSMADANGAAASDLEAIKQRQTEVMLLTGMT